MRLRWCVNIFLLLFPIMAIQAQWRTKDMSHFVGFVVGGGETNNLFYTDNVGNKAGGAANLSFRYELHTHHFIFGVGVESQYQYTNDTAAAFVDEFDRVDRTEETLKYDYVYNYYHNFAHNVRVTFPIYAGYESENYWYVLAGAKFSVSLLSNATVQTDMYTQGIYSWSIEPIRSIGPNDFTSYGFYPEQSYSYKENNADNWWVAATAEVGCTIPLNSKNVRMRAGIYADYAFRIGQINNNPIVDYAAIDVNPTSQNLQNLQQNIVLHPILFSNRLQSMAHNIEIGVHWTVLFDVTTHRSPCRCLQ